jgi:6-phosphogluconolactonase/glucosamine-6-phosphate isomerase/deaminase
VSGEPRIEILDDPDAVSHAAAQLIASILAGAVEARGRAHWATTGGSTPTGIYRELAAPPHRDEVPWQDVHVWWGDDRYVPRDHPLSNVLPLDQVLVSMTARAGLSGAGADAVEVDLGIEPGAPLPPGNIHAPAMSHAIGAAAGPGLAADLYERELREAGLDLSAEGFPIFDLVLLGIGPDGHVLSVFPRSEVFDTKAWVTAVPAPTHVEPHVPRITLHPGVLDAAREVVVVVHGDSKRGILATVLGDERDARRWPAQLARREGARWFLDRAAAAGPSR